MSILDERNKDIPPPTPPYSSFLSSRGARYETGKAQRDKEGEKRRQQQISQPKHAIGHFLRPMFLRSCTPFPSVQNFKETKLNSKFFDDAADSNVLAKLLKNL